MDISLGSVLTDSGTADGEVAALEERMFKRYRNWLDAWRDAHIKMFGESDPAQTSRARLASTGTVFEVVGRP